MGDSSKRKRLFALYFVLIVLPSVILATLYVQALRREYRAAAESLPREAKAAARSIEARIGNELRTLLEGENERHFRYFARSVAFGDDLKLLQTEVTPLVSTVAPSGLVCWFAVEAEKFEFRGLELFKPVNRRDDSDTNGYYPLVSKFAQRYLSGSLGERMDDLVEARTLRTPFRTLGVMILSDVEEDKQCMQRYMNLLDETEYDVTVSRFELDVLEGIGDEPVLLARRRILLSEPIGGLPPLPEGGPCVEEMTENRQLIQGFFVDSKWLLEDLVQEFAADFESEALRLAPRGSQPREDWIAIRPLVTFEAEGIPDLDFGVRHLSLDTGTLEARHRSSRQRLLGLCLMLFAAIASGVLLLYRRVRIEAEQAQRTQDFVAAVTHELRTPLATIRVHGEMLADGWVDSEEVRSSYYTRILDETERLSGLVERILETSRVKQRPETLLEPGDLNSLVAGLAPGLERPNGDLAFEYAEDLPTVLVRAEELASILQNLVENARKYAPVPEGGEPIRVRTRRVDGSVSLEVLDRGPGIPAAERERIFEAFYRIGHEHRRTTRGTGLGLHLVDQSVKALGGGVDVLDRPGGGSIFRVRFQSA